MSGNLGYTKKFIILKKDFSNMSGLNPKGHGKLEVKGLKGSIVISLENAQDNDFYNVVLISRNTSYDLGKVYTDDIGRAREELIFNLQDLESKGFSIDKINGIVVKKDSNILVGGYINKDDGSIERYIKELPIQETAHEELAVEESEVEVEPEVEETVAEEPIITEPVYIEPILEEPIIEVVEVAEEPEIEELKIEELKIEKPIIEEPLIEEEIIIATDDDFKYESTNDLIIDQILEPEAGGDFEPIFEPILELTQEPEPVAEEPIEEQYIEEQPVEEQQPVELQFVDEQHPVENEELVVDIIEEPPMTEQYIEEILEKVDLDSEYNRKVSQRNQTTSYVLNILRYFPYIEPFRIRLEGYNWWKIDFQDEARGFLPYFSYVVGGEQKSRRSDNYITSRDLMGIYNHYLFGLYTVGEEVAYYVYAVPGGFYKDEHPHGGNTGFNTWFAGEDIGGYWLLYIDPLTGNVIKPINPMIPTE